jgi:hypothetical protein
MAWLLASAPLSLYGAFVGAVGAASNSSVPTSLLATLLQARNATSPSVEKAGLRTLIPLVKDELDELVEDARDADGEEAATKLVSFRKAYLSALRELSAEALSTDALVKAKEGLDRCLRDDDDDDEGVCEGGGALVERARRRYLMLGLPEKRAVTRSVLVPVKGMAETRSFARAKTLVFILAALAAVLTYYKWDVVKDSSIFSLFGRRGGPPPPPREPSRPRRDDDTRAEMNWKRQREQRLRQEREDDEAGFHQSVKDAVRAKKKLRRSGIFSLSPFEMWTIFTAMVGTGTNLITLGTILYLAVKLRKEITEWMKRLQGLFDSEKAFDEASAQGVGLGPLLHREDAHEAESANAFVDAGDPFRHLPPR